MTPERKRIARYIMRLGKLMGLSGWTINLHDDEPDTKDSYAAVSCVYGRRIANVWLGHGFEHLDPVTQRHVLVHELLHVHLEPMRALVQNALPGVLGGTAFVVFEEAYRQADEHATDAIADAIASAFPLPE